MELHTGAHWDIVRMQQKTEKSDSAADSIILQIAAAPGNCAGNVVVAQAGFDQFQLAMGAAKHGNFGE